MRQSIQGVIGEVDTLPGCSQVAVSHSVYVPEQLRGAGIGEEANAARVDLLIDEMGYDCIICTVCSENKAQLKILERNGWTHLLTFKSRKTGHSVQLWGYTDS